MKCLCGYEGDKNNFIDCKVTVVHYGRDPDTKEKREHSYFRDAFACPKCGTLKIEVKE